MICADCKMEYPIHVMYFIVAPIDRQLEEYAREPHRGRFYLCTNCWDNIIGHAALGMIR